MKKKILIPMIMFMSVISSCGKNSSSPEFHVNDATNQTLDPDQKVTYSEIKSKIINPKCISCHSNLSTEAGLKNWITPGNPDKSSFFTTMESGSMPKGGSPVGTALLELTRNYITQMATPSTSGSTTGSASGGTTTTPAPPTTNGITFSELKTNILTAYRCTSCHSVGTESSLTKWINTTTPENSKLYTYMKSGAMPPSGPKASQEDLDYVLQYLNDFSTR